MTLTFEWDEAKATENLRKHGVGFDEAKTVFGDHLSLTIADTQHSAGEGRYIDIGMSVRQRLLVVVYTEKATNKIRIISSRRATKAEQREYEYGT